ncbi:MAG: 50S ribosomal protein L25 [Anaerolineales bacterium]|nr:50S ribosomal protein L25 [Anaerolineales bacterium]MCZ2122155.1 50S ribosomal protein L25 [Anaerolineales bacterium]
MEKVVLKAEKRDVTGKQVGALRRAGKLPAVIYGRHVEPVAILLDAHSTSLTLAKLSSSSLVTIDLNGTEYPALVRERQRNPVKGTLTHIDFLAVNLKEKIRASVRFAFTGVSGAVKDYNAVLIHGIAALEVECLPTDLPERIEVDISAMKLVGDGIHVKDITLPAEVRLITDEHEMIVVATAPKVDAVEAPAAGAATESAAEAGKDEEKK